MSCPFVITKGARKGETCNKPSKNDQIKYCRDHVRNIGVQKELLAQGIDITGGSTAPTKSIVPSQLTTDDTTIRPIDSKYNIPIINPPPAPAKVKDQNKKSSFITSFESNIDHKISNTPADSAIDMDTVYDHLESDDEDDDDEGAVAHERVISEQRAIIENQQQQILHQQRRITSMYTMKQIMYVGLNATASMIEGISPEKLDGYQSKVATSPAINEIMDEMSADMESLIGFSEMPAWMRLGLTMGAIASATVAEKSGVYVRDVKEPIPSAPIPEELVSDEHFTPAYKE